MISQRVANLTPSPTLTLDAKVKTLQAQGQSVINLCVGEPDFDTPQHVQDAAFQAMQDGFTHYTVTAGIQELREAIVEKFKKDNTITYNPSEVIVGMGSKPLLYLAFLSLLNKDDEVLIPTPTWNSFVEQVKLVGGKPVLVPLQPPFKLLAADIKEKITKKTRMLLVNTPSNPTGAMIDSIELEKIAELAVENDFFILADEIYEKIVYTQQHISIASLSAAIKQKTITINGFSKAYAMTGWRIGYAGGPQEIIQAMVALQGQITSNVASFVQRAGIEALKGDQNDLMKMTKAFSERRRFVIQTLKNIPGITFSEPEGAFYVFISVEKKLGKVYKSSSEWCEALLEKQSVAVVPGEGFFRPGYFRLSYAASMEELKRGIEGIKKFILDQYT